MSGYPRFAAGRPSQSRDGQPFINGDHPVRPDGPIPTEGSGAHTALTRTSLSRFAGAPDDQFNFNDDDEDMMLEGGSIKSHSSTSSGSTASVIPVSIDHPPVDGDKSFLVYFEARDFHQSPDDGRYNYLGEMIGEEVVWDILLDALAMRNTDRDRLDYLQCAMCHMLKAIAHADKERAINVEESNDTSGYRTLSCVLMEGTISQRSIRSVISNWKEMAGNDSLLCHCASSMPSTKVALLMQATFRRSAPMLTWRLDLSDLL